MKVLLRTESEEGVEFDVLPNDTFSDLSQRLLELGKVSVNLTQLSSKGRPVDMSANVMEYFNVGSKLLNSSEKDSEQSNSKDNISGELEPNVSNDTINTSKSSGESDKYSSSVDLSQEILSFAGEIKLGEVFDCLSGSKSDNDIKNSSGNSLGDVGASETKVLCRLCAQATDSNNVKYLFDCPPPPDDMTLAEMVNTSLPVYVSQEDDLPKQICMRCLSQLETNYQFVKMVTQAEEKLEGIHFEASPKGDECYDCPFCVGDMFCSKIEENPQSAGNKVDSDNISLTGTSPNELEDSLSYENMNESFPTEPEEQNNSKLSETSIDETSSAVESRKRRGRPKKIVDKKTTENEDKDWSAKDELKPIKRRGRPKGSKNKPVINKPSEVDCKICERSFPDISSVLAHTLLSHCEDGSDSLPCPLCNSVWPDEGELVYHVNNHSATHQVVINQCALCPKAYKEKGELEQHLFEDHIKKSSSRVECKTCDMLFPSSMSLATHVADTHSLDSCSNTWKCPFCKLAFSDREESMHHFLTVHPPGSGATYTCPKCDDAIVSVKGLVKHLLEKHCSEHLIERPMVYKCTACNAKFKNQYSLIKHPCTGVDNLFCEDCGISFPIKARYVLHLQFHNENQNFEMRCDVCLAEFNEENNFYNHIRFQHEADQNLECSKCKKIFKNHSSLTLHMRRHEEIRKHKCEVCGKTFLNAQTLREHSVSHMKVKPYQCQQCGQCLSRPSRLRLHLRSHSVQRSNTSMTCYSCSECTQVFPNLEQAEHHCEQHRDILTKVEVTKIVVRQVLRCEFCDSCYVNHEHLNTHRSTFHSNSDPANSFTCSICGSKFSSYARVATHKLSHGITTETLILPNQDNEDAMETEYSAPVQFTVPQYFVCELCNKECLHYTYLNMHRKICHPKKNPVHSCKDCNQLFSTAWALHYHRRKMHNLRARLSKTNKSSRKDSEEDDLYECPQCLRHYASPETLDIHMKRLHVRNTKQFAGYMCETCGKTFAFKGSWQSHCDAHNGIKRFQCKECEKRFTHKAGLTKHMKLHSSDRPFLCEYCGKKFRDRTERDNHIRAHTGERPFMCDICGRTFFTRAVWLDHSRIHQDIRPHHCDQCGQSFRRSFALKSHYLIHTGERPFRCKICDKDFRLKQSLTTHMKKDHEYQTDSSLSNTDSSGTDLKIKETNNCDLSDKGIETDEERVLQDSEIVEDDIISFQTYDQFITKSVIDKELSKSELISTYESSELIEDQDENVDKPGSVQDIFTEKSLQSPLNTTTKLIVTNSPLRVRYSQINSNVIRAIKSRKRSVNISGEYCEEPTEKKGKEDTATESSPNADLPVIQELCHVMDETVDSK